MIFGTDGIRGIVDKDINCKLAYDVGRGFTLYLRKHNQTQRKGKYERKKDWKLINSSLDYQEFQKDTLRHPEKTG